MQNPDHKITKHVGKLDDSFMIIECLLYTKTLGYIVKNLVQFPL